MTRDYHAIADRWVSEFVDRHIKTRILDGRPDRVFVKTLTIELGALLREEVDAALADKKKKGA